jgi:hypothetical protein
MIGFVVGTSVGRVVIVIVGINVVDAGTGTVVGRRVCSTVITSTRDPPLAEPDPLSEVGDG